jgi:hypothetical protein
LADSLEIGGSVQGVATAQQQLDEVASDITSSDIQTLGKVVENNGLVDGNDVSDTISRVNDDTGAKT